MRLLPQTLSAQFLWVWPSLVLGTLGLTELHALWSGQAQGLLHPSFHPFVLVSGLLLVSLALLRVLTGCALESVQVNSGLWLRLVVAGLLLALVIGLQKAAPSSGYSALAFDNRGFTDRAMPIMSSKYNETTAQGLPASNQVLECEVVDLLMAASDPDLVKSLEGRHVRFIGQFLPMDEKQFQIVRLMMYCCAADAQPVGLQITGQASGFQKMDWAEIQGVAHFIPDGQSWKVDLHLEKISPTATPKEIFLY